MSMTIHIEPRHGCWRCGALHGEYHIDEKTNVPVCGSCGEHAILTFQQALDTLNNLYLKHGSFSPAEDDEGVFE